MYVHNNKNAIDLLVCISHLVISAIFCKKVDKHFMLNIFCKILYLHHKQKTPTLNLT